MALGLCLLATLTFAWAAFGAVHHGARAVVHLLLAVTLGLAVALPDESLRHAGAVRRLAAAMALLAAALLVGLVPLPAAVRGVLAPGTVAARPEAQWWTLSLSPEATVGELCELLLPAGVLVAATVWGAAWFRRSGLERGLRVAFVVVVAFGAVHAASGTTAVLGVFPSSLREGQRFFAPFVDPNHLGSAVVLLSAPVLAAWSDVERRWEDRLGWGVAAAAGFALLGWIRSSGAVIAELVVVGLIGARALADRGIGSRGMAATGAAGVAAVGGLWVWLGDPSGGATFPERLRVWGRALRTWPSFWFAGSGGGTFGRAIEPQLHEYTAWGHAHSDYVEFALECGAIGLVAAAGAAVLLRPGPAAAKVGRSDALVVGLLGLATHALVDFPLQIPALAMGAAAMWGLRRGAYDRREERPASAARAVLAPLAALEVLAAGWELRTAAVDQAMDALRDGRPASELGVRLAWGRPEPALAEARRAAAMGDEARAIEVARGVLRDHPDDPAALRVAGLVLAQSGDAAGARAAFDRAIERYPGDWRSWVARARAAPRGIAGDDRVSPAGVAWVDAFRAGAPALFLDEALPTVPVGLFWLDVAEERGGPFTLRLADRLAAADPEAADLAYDAAYRADPTLPARPGWVKALLALDRPEAAGVVVVAALRQDPRDPRFLQLQAEVLDASGLHAEAATAWMSLARRHPELLSRAIRSAGRAGGSAAASALVDEWGRALDDGARLELAGLLRADGRAIECMRVLAEAKRPATTDALRKRCTPPEPSDVGGAP